MNPILRGWSNYYRTVCSKETYSKLGHLVYQRLFRWARRRHPNKGTKWVVNKYWKTIGQDNWIFGDKNSVLYRHSKTPIVRHTKVKGEASPYDGNTKYWASRMGRHPEVRDSVARLLKKQKGKCTMCNLTFREDDVIEKDHVKPRALGGKHKDNIQLLHRHCHDVKTKTDIKAILTSKKASKVGSKSTFYQLVEKFIPGYWEWVSNPCMGEYSKRTSY